MFFDDRQQLLEGDPGMQAHARITEVDGVDEQGGIERHMCRDVDEAVDAGGDAACVIIRRPAAIAESDDGELAPVMMFEEPRAQIGDGVLTKVTREIADRDLGFRRRTARSLGGGGGIFVADESLGRGKPGFPRGRSGCVAERGAQ